MRATVFGEVDDFVRNIIGGSSYHGLPVTNIPYSGTSVFDLKFEVAHIICHKYISNIAACFWGTRLNTRCGDVSNVRNVNVDR